MSTIKVTSTTGVDFDHYDLPNPNIGIVKSHTPTKWHIDYNPGIFDEVVGKGLQYDVDNDLIDGTITGFTFVESKTDKFTVTGLNLDATVLTGAPDGNDFLSQALAGSDSITGGNGDDHLLGFAGFDTIDGGKGADKMEGGADSDTYIVDNIGDTVIEKSGGGDFDKVQIGINTINVPIAEVEIYLYTGKGNWTFDATGFGIGVGVGGGAGNDVLKGSDGNDTLNGGKGVDTLSGGLGDDSYFIDNIAELAPGKINDTGGTDLLITTVAPTAIAGIESYNYTGKTNWTFTASDGVKHSLSGGGGIDTLTGGDGDDTINGHDGNDVLSGGLGADHMVGGKGNDTYTIDNAGDTVLEFAKEGVDTVKSIFDVDLVKDSTFLIDRDIENVFLLTGAVKATGNALNNVLNGNDAANTLDGAGGNDTLIGGLGDDSLKGGTGKDAMTGGAGNDTYFVDNAGDKVTEKAGEGDHDKVVSDILLKAVIANVEDYQYTGASAWTFTGSKGDNAITGGSGNDTLAGGGGKDTLAGGLGNDTYTIDADDTVTEGGGGGTDSVKFSDPAITAIANVENYIFTGKGAWTFAANALDNVVQGGTGNRILDGGAGIDTAVFTGKFADYQISYAGDEITVKGKTGVTDTLTGFEKLQFADSTINALSTVQFVGENVGDGLGGRVSLAGDVNDDGFLDIIVGAVGADPHGSGSGAAYVLFGSADGLQAASLGALDGTNGFKLSGAAANDLAGFVAGVGDVNDDGVDDIIVGARGVDGAGTTTGAAYVVFGHSGAFSKDIDLSTVSGATGFKLQPSGAFDAFGYAVSAAGDVNGDGIADFVVGESVASGANHSYVVFGSDKGFPNLLNPDNLNGANGFKVSGGNGSPVSGAGDFNGDGIDDLLLGDPDYGGGAYLVFGKDTGFSAGLDLTKLSGADGFKVTGTFALGWSVAGAGDVNGDGFADIIVGSAHGGKLTGNPGNFGYQGEAFVLFGSDAPFAATFDTKSVNGTNGFKMTGAAQDYAGRIVSGAGDVNGDGYDDLVVTAWELAQDGEGTNYVVFGHAGKFTANIDLTKLTSAQGFAIPGENPEDGNGTQVTAAGDLNGDGFDDLIIGVSGSDANGTDSGTVTIVYGNASAAASQIRGDDFDNTLDGGKGADVLIGGNGNDTLNGAGGNDQLYGGEGNDAIHVGSNTFVRVDGGGGIDTLFFDYKGAIDLGNVDGKTTTSEHGKMEGLEVLNFDNGQANAVTVHAIDVLNIGDAGFTTKFDGNAGDTLKLFKSDSWVDQGTAGGYTTYDNGIAVIKVDTDIAVTLT